MTSGSGQLNPIRPLSLGDIVSVGFRLYAAKPKQYLGISLVAVLWILLPFFLLIPIGVLVAIAVPNLSEQIASVIGIIVLVVVAFLVLLTYCSAKYLTNAALISRLAFGELTNQPEELRDARRFVRSRTWSFWLAQLFKGLIGMGVGGVIAIVFVILIAALGAVIRASQGNSGTSAVTIVLGILLGLLFLAAIVGTILLLCWLGARLEAAELPLAVERESSAAGTIGRIWSLSRGSAWRIFLTLFIAGVITMPIFMLGWFIGLIPQLLLIGFLATTSGSTGQPSESATVLVQVLSQVINQVISLLLNIIVLPFWQMIKAAIYYDLRGRREGLGLQLQDRGT